MYKTASLAGTCFIAQGTQLGALWCPKGWDEGGGGREVQEGKDVCPYS